MEKYDAAFSATENELIYELSKFVKDTHFILVKPHPRENREFYRNICQHSA